MSLDTKKKVEGQIFTEHKEDINLGSPHMVFC